MKKICSIVLASAITLTLFAGCGTSGKSTVNGGEHAQVDTLTLVNEGVSDYVIVRGANASASEVTASTELQSYLKQISGAELEIVTDDTAAVDKEIVVGKTNRETEGEFDRDELGDEGFVIKTEGSKLYIVGGELRGTLYGVYTFLEEHLGCRFYTVTVEKIPDTKTITLEKIAEDKQIPVFEFRDIDWVSSRQGNLQAKLKVNGLYNALGEEYGGNITYAGFVHTCLGLVNPDIYFAEHPEYYSTDDDGVPAQLCLSNPDVLAIATETARQWLIDKPNAKIISISQNDNQDMCKCEECSKIYEEEGSYSGAMIRFVNAIATALKDEFPNVKFDTLAYQYTRTVPALVKPADNVIVRLCTIECCFSHPLGECDDVYVSESKGESMSIADDIKAWADITDSLYVWDYTTDYSHTCMFFPNFRSMLKNVQFFANNHVIGVYEEGNYFSDTADFPELRAYILAKILWNPYMTEEEYWGYIDDFLENVYGEGWTYLREYIDLAQSLTVDIHFGIFDDPNEIYPIVRYDLSDEKALPEDLTLDMILNYENTDWSEYSNWYIGYTENDITAKGAELFDKAAELAADDEQLSLINKMKLQIDYIRSYYLFSNMKVTVNNIKLLLQKYFEANDTGISAEEQEELLVSIPRYALSQMKEAYVVYNQNLYNNLIENGITNISEGTNLLSLENPNFQSTPKDWD